MSEDIYVESDDVNPRHINYTPVDGDIVAEIIDDDEDISSKKTFQPKKTFLRYVKNSKRKTK